MVLKFDLSSIPANTQIENAQLSLYTFDHFYGYQGRVLPNGPKTLHVITTPWEEAKVTWQYPPEFIETPIDTSYEDDIKVWEHFDVTNYVNDILSGKKENLGLLIKQVPTFDAREVPSTGIQMYSSEHSLIEMRPKLTIRTDDGTALVATKVKSVLPQSGSYSIDVLNFKGQIVDNFLIEDIRKIQSVLKGKCVSNLFVVNVKNRNGELVHNFIFNNM